MAAPLTGVFERILSQSRYQYWALQILGWGGYAFFIVLGSWLWGKSSMVDAMYAVLSTGMGLLFSVGMHKGYKLVWDKPVVQRFLFSLLILGVATALWAGWKFYVFVALHDRPMENILAEYIYWYSYSLFILLSWTGLYYGIKYYRIVQQEREKTLRITAMAHQAQLKMLQYQIHPHFLFNTLNAVSTLIMEGNGDVANRMVSALSKFLRYSLDSDPMQKVTLDQEVQAMQLYLDIEKVRFGERLHIEFKLDDKAGQALVPGMLLQPLVENSIKYAIAKSEAGGSIRLAANVFADDLLLELSDDGPGVELTESELPAENGVGLTNTRERLQTLYGNHHAFRLQNVMPHGLQISIRIPFEKQVTVGTWKN